MVLAELSRLLGRKVAKAPKVRIFTTAWAKPKPLHAQILENWALCRSIRFSVLTDRPELWAPLVTGDNCDIIHMPVPEWFRRAEHALGYTDASSEFAELINRQFLGQMNGWTACFFRPLIPRLVDIGDADIWGWIDWDVLVDPTALPNYLRDVRSQLILFPPEYTMWEHFKLFRSDVDLLPAFLHVMNATEPGTPLCASTCYALGDGRFTRDNIPQSKIAVHWHYSDKMGVPNGVDVTQTAENTLVDANGEKCLFFVADTQVKEWTSTDVDAYTSARRRHQPFFFKIHAEIGIVRSTCATDLMVEPACEARGAYSAALLHAGFGREAPAVSACLDWTSSACGRLRPS